MCDRLAKRRVKSRSSDVWAKSCTACTPTINLPSSDALCAVSDTRAVLIVAPRDTSTLRKRRPITPPFFKFRTGS